MINFLTKYSLLLSIICLYLSQISNAVCDRLRFTGMNEQYNHLFHFLKYGIDRPGLFLFGVFSVNILLEQYNRGDLWHYRKRFIIWLFFFINSFFLWNLVYRLIK